MVRTVQPKIRIGKLNKMFQEASKFISYVHYTWLETSIKSDQCNTLRMIDTEDEGGLRLSYTHCNSDTNTA